MPPKPVPIFSQPVTVVPSRPNDQHDIATTLALVDTLDTLPGELTKTFGDLRELDAVLNSTTTNITLKLRALTETLQDINRNMTGATTHRLTENCSGNDMKDTFRQVDGTRSDSTLHHVDQQLQRQSSHARPLDRFQLLLEVAEELTRYKIGVEDKVRVSGQACDTMVAHQAHLQALLVNSSVLLASPLTTPVDHPKLQGALIQGRRQRVSPFHAAVANSYISVLGGADQETSFQVTRERDLGYDAEDVTPSKRRKPGKEKNLTDMDAWDSQEPSVGLESIGLAKKSAGGGSASLSSREKKNAPKRRSRNSPAVSIRDASIHFRNAKHDALQVVLDSGDRLPTNEDRRPADSPGPSINLNSGDAPDAKYSQGVYPSINMSGHVSAKGAGADGAHGKSQLSDRSGARTNSRRDGSDHLDTQHVAPFHDSTEMDHDPTPYCYCQKQSYGEMIGCDSDDCRYEWFHLSCLNLSQPPDGTWLCPECEVREQKEKRSKPRKTGTTAKIAKKRV